MTQSLNASETKCSAQRVQWVPGLVLALALSIVTTGCQREVPSGDALHLKWELLGNQEEGQNRFRAALTIANRGAPPLVHPWSLYFNIRLPLDPGVLEGGLELKRIDGTFWRLQTTPDFPGLRSGESIRVEHTGQPWAFKESDAPTGYYVVFGEGEDAGDPQQVESLELVPFSDPIQTQRTAFDQVFPSTPESRFEENARLRLLPRGDLGRVIPTPRSRESGDGEFTLSTSSQILFAEGLKAEADYLSRELSHNLGARLTVKQSAGGEPNSVRLEIADLQSGGSTLPDSGYVLSIQSDQVRLRAASREGIFYAIQTLLSLLPIETFAAPQPQIMIGQQRITDWPEFRYRGMHLDVSRNFQTKETILKFLDLMAFYKLNKFHFHLTDDEGWRIAIEGLPELTEVGGRRGHTLDQSEYLIPTHGSGPFVDRFPGSGFYSREDFLEILRHAAERHIEVIPELDFPGHAHAAIQAMEVRFERYAAKGDQAQGEMYRLIDAEDESEHRSVQGWGRNVINVCQDSTYRFLELVVEDMVKIYSDAGLELRTLHIGGDEVPEGVWEKSPACKRLFERETSVNSPADLPDYFLDRTARILSRHSVITAGWEEIALTRNDEGTVVPNSVFMDRGFMPYFWHSVPTWGGEEHGYQLANAGYDVVLSNASNLYFDLAYNKDPKEAGLHWAGFVDTRKTWDFVPLNVYESNSEDIFGRPLNRNNDSLTALTADGRSHLLGIQGQLWGESLTSAERLEYMAFPKLLALAERAWASGPQWASLSGERRSESKEAEWNRFVNEVGQVQLPRLDHLQGGVLYRLPPPGARIRSGTFEVNVSFPGLAVRFTTDGSEPTPESRLYTGPVEVGDEVRLATFDTRGRASRTVVLRR